jgi:hypothetical protein
MSYSASLRRTWLGLLLMLPVSLAAQQEPAYIVSPGGAWIRKNPSLDAKKETLLMIGWQVQILGPAGPGWLKVRTETPSSPSPLYGYLLGEETSLPRTANIGVRPFFGIYRPF